MDECVGVPDGGTGEPDKVYSEVKYIFVRLSVLREYLEKELEMPNLPFKYEFERALDDWVMICFFVGTFSHSMFTTKRTLDAPTVRENSVDELKINSK